MVWLSVLSTDVGLGFRGFCGSVYQQVGLTLPVFEVSSTLSCFLI